jgi:hypothetical protein
VVTRHSTRPTSAIDAPRHDLHNVLIVYTCAVDGPRGTGISHFEIHLAADVGHDAPGLLTLTRDPALFWRAMVLEDCGRRVDVRWHASRRPNGAYCQLLDSLEERTDP